MRTLLRRYWLSVAATAHVLLLVTLPGEDFAQEAPAVILTTVATMLVLLRFVVATRCAVFRIASTL
jgi:hypothetical protein